MTGRRIRFAVIALSLVFLSARSTAILAAERLVGLQSAPSIAMAVPWFAEEARLYPKYDLDFQLVYIASSGIVTAAMSGGNGSVAIAGGEGPIRAFLSGNTDFVFIGSVKNVLTHSIMGKPDIKSPEDLKVRKSASAASAVTRTTLRNTQCARRAWTWRETQTTFKPAALPKRF